MSALHPLARLAAEPYGPPMANFSLRYGGMKPPASKMWGLSPVRVTVRRDQTMPTAVQLHSLVAGATLRAFNLAQINLPIIRPMLLEHLERRHQ